MDLIETDEGDVTLVTVEWGRGVLRWDHGALVRSVRRLVARGRRRIVIDLGEAPHFDSASVSEIVQCMAAAGRRGGEIRLREPRGKVRQILAHAGLLEALTEEPEAG